MGNKQFAALPFRLDNSELRVMLITTRRKRRWSVPKGSLIRNTSPHRTAALEAYEEAGVMGVIAKRALGSFKHRKRKGERTRTVDVAVFPMKVHGRERWWPVRTFPLVPTGVSKRGLATPGVSTAYSSMIRRASSSRDGLGSCASLFFF
ncbi:NUDIX hydrolase (plasmid) [Bradyrhizobium sp. PMVTL-01]|uniref:NUDIX hydrolase n=1 Tax=Bradyrhizobium sp. PMVTL-01 TaxID=3434999 RepID=UPI003F7119A6